MEASDDNAEVDEILEFITVAVILAVFAVCVVYKWAVQENGLADNETVTTNQTMRASDFR